jgi:hypothetical protein
MFHLTFFFLISSSYSSFILVKKLDSIEIPKDIDVDWPHLYTEFRALSYLDPTHLATLLQKSFFIEKLEIFQAKIINFFSFKTVEAFTALENKPDDFGLVLFFIRALIFDTSHDLKFYSKFFFSFDDFIYKNLKKKYIKSTVKYFSEYLNLYKTSEILGLVVRIFERLEIKLKGKAEIKELNKAIKMWKYEIYVLDWKAAKTTNKDRLNPKNSITEEEPLLAPEVILLHEDLIESFDHLRKVFRSKRASENFIFTGFCERFGSLAEEFFEKSGDFGFLLKQRIEFAIIMIDYIFEGLWDFYRGKNKIQTNFETFFQTRDEDKIKSLASSCQINLKGMLAYKKGNGGTARMHWLGWNPQIMNNSILKIVNLSEKIYRLFPNPLVELVE